ncbi:polynucleotide adenylyltransferase, partial [Acinetobacter baumannii]|nr:polynucleotide adenylyltransferase [Acinetobacter baumannii]
PTLKNISAERIQTELLKLLVSKNPHYLKIVWELGITKIVLPEFDVMMETDRGEKTLKAFAYTNADKVERLAVLFANMEDTPEKGRDLAKKI